MAKVRAADAIPAWLGRVCAAENPPGSVVAYNVGLFETRKGYTAYLVGAATFDERNSDWACREAFTPAERECRLPAGEFENWEQVHQAVVAAVRAFLESAAGRQSFLNRAEAVTVGFDDGELERVK